MTGPRHAGPRRHTSWWRGPWPPMLTLVAFVAAAIVTVVLSPS